MSSHTHSHTGQKSMLRASKSCRLGMVLILTIGFFFVELICGYILHSVAVAADAIHMLSDSGALIIAMVSVHVSSCLLSGLQSSQQSETTSRRDASLQFVWDERKRSEEKIL